MKNRPSAEEMFDIMQLALADVEDSQDRSNGGNLVRHHALFDIIFSGATARAFPETVFLRLYCMDRKKIGEPLPNMEIVATLGNQVIESKGLSLLSEVKNTLMAENAETLDSFNSDRDEVNDAVLILEQDLRVNGAGDPFSMSPLAIIIADRAQVHLGNWEARQIQAATPNKPKRGLTARL